MRSLPLALVLVGCGPWDSLKVHATYPSLLKVVKAIFKLYFCFFKGIHYFAGPCVERLMILFGTNNICNAFFHHLCFNSYQLICWFLCKIVLDLYNCIHFFFFFSLLMMMANVTWRSTIRLTSGKIGPTLNYLKRDRI